MVNKIIFSCTCQECDFDMGINLVVQLKYLKCPWVLTDINLIWTCTTSCFTFNDSQFLHFSIQIKYKLFLILYCVVTFSVEMISCLSGLGFTFNINKYYDQIRFVWSQKNDLTVYLMRNIFFPTDEIWKKPDIISKSSIRCLLPIWHLSTTKFNTFDVLPFWHFLCSKQSNGIY